MKKTILGVLGSNFSAAGIGFLINIILARVLEVEEYGRINLVLTTIIVVFTIFEFGFSNSVVIFYNKFKDKYRNIELLINNLYSKYILLVTIPIIILVFIMKYFYSLTTIETSIIILNILVLSIYRYVLSIYQAKAEWKVYNIMNMLFNIIKLLILFIILSFIYYLNYDDKYHMILVTYGISALILVFIILYTSNIFSKSISHKISIYKDFTKILFPIGAMNIFIIISMRADVFFIEKYFGLEQLAVYVAANSLALVFPLITSSLMNVFLQKSSSSSSNFLKQIFIEQKKYIPHLIIILIISVIISKPLFMVLFGDRYVESIDIFRILLVAYIGGIFFTPLESYLYAHHIKFVLMIKFIQMIIIIFGMGIGLKYFSLEVAAIVVVISRLVAWVAIFVKSKQIYILAVEGKRC